MSAMVDREKKQIVRFSKVTQKRIRDCLGDRKLPRMPQR
jgi:hypothetical protein